MKHTYSCQIKYVLLSLVTRLLSALQEINNQHVGCNNLYENGLGFMLKFIMQKLGVDCCREIFSSYEILGTMDGVI